MPIKQIAKALERFPQDDLDIQTVFNIYAKLNPLSELELIA